MLKSAGRYLRTLVHLRPWQVAGRLVAPVRRRATVRRLPEPPSGLRSRWQPRVAPPAHDPWNSRDALLEGRFCFLREEHALGWPPDWQPDHLSLLWRFNLHYFHYLHLLRPDEQAALCRSWVRGNPAGRGAGWHPYPTSLRIVNWCRAGLEEQDLLESLYRQAAYLSRNMETYVYGNHLLENARALVMAGAFFGDHGEAPAWLEKGLDVLRRETGEQILVDGGHYERSPMYHALMTEAYLDVLNVLPEGHDDRAWLGETVRRMGDVAATVTHPDGQLALFNDSTQEIALPPHVLLDYLTDLTGHEPEVLGALPEMGYFVHRSPEVYLVIDGGSVGPGHLMAHAHADVFSYELSLQGVQMIVDSGVYEYPAGAMREHVRSTEAHNTVAVDGVDQVECWGSFRVGARADPHDVAFAREKEKSRFEGAFSGYARRLGDGIVHRRRVVVDEGKRRIVVKDVVEGSGRHRVESRMHFHPEVDFSVAGGALHVRRSGVSCTLRTSGGEWHRERGWYCPEFGVRHQNEVLVLGGDVVLPAELEYEIVY